MSDGVYRDAAAARVCAGCGHQVPVGRTLCPNCGRVYLAPRRAQAPTSSFAAVAAPFPPAPVGPPPEPTRGPEPLPGPPTEVLPHAPEATSEWPPAEWLPPPPDAEVAGGAGGPFTGHPEGVDEPKPPKKPVAVGTIVRSVLGIAVVIGIVAVALIGYPKASDWSDEMAEPVAVRGTTIPAPTTTLPPPTTTAPHNAIPIGSVCDSDTGAANALKPLTVQPAPAPNRPGQHALLIKTGNVHGNLDLAPGGGFTFGHTPASDAKTVFIVCGIAIDANNTGQQCQYIEKSTFGLETGRQFTTTIGLARLQLNAYEARTGKKVGAGAVEARNTGCPASTTDYSDGMVEVTGGLDDRMVEWTRTHLTGARYH